MKATRRWRYRSAGLAAAVALGLGAGSAAWASVADEERVFRQDALAHAEAVASAYRVLEEHILLHSTAATSWPASVQPSSVTGWVPSLRERGVWARYCDDTLLVYLNVPAGQTGLKGVGEDHRSVLVAPHAFVGEGNDGRFPVLHWLDGNVARGGIGRPDVALPACMTGTPLPSGRAALAGSVADPYAAGNLTTNVSYEMALRDCPAGTHGPGQRFAREIRERHTGRGQAIVGSEVRDPWQLVGDACRLDYTEWEYFTKECRWNAGPPHNREMVGEEIWRRSKSVRGREPERRVAIVTHGAPEWLSRSCWDVVAAGSHPDPELMFETSVQQTATVACPEGYRGTRQNTRTKTTRSTKFPWDAVPVVTVRYTPWRETSNWCVEDLGTQRRNGGGGNDCVGCGPPPTQVANKLGIVPGTGSSSSPRPDKGGTKR